MKRGINAFFWVALLLAAVVVLVRVQGNKNARTFPATATATASSITSAPRLALPQPQPVDAAVERPVPPAFVGPSEKAVMDELRATVKSDPARATELAMEARKRFGNDTADAEERDALLIDSLINQQRIGAARAEAEDYLERYPQGRFAQHIFIMLGVHPRPHGPNR